MEIMKPKKKLSSFQIILLGFAGVILLGTFLLMLPISSQSHQWTSFIDALFTSTSAVCVTGLVVFDTSTYWTIFGQIIILLMIQIGGMGVVTIAVFLAVISGKKIGLFSRETMKSAISAPNLSGIVRLTGFIIKGILLIELLGALIMLPVFCIDYGAEGIWYAIFHSISAFCNAGFDIMGSKSGEFTSITYYSAQPVINITIMLLMKTTTIAVLFSSTISIFRKKDNAEIMKRRISDETVKTALAIFIMYITLFLFGGMAISKIENLPITSCLYESASAVATVGLTLGITPSLGIISKLILILSMFFGRVGGLTLIYATFGANKKQIAKLPTDTIAVG